MVPTWRSFMRTSACCLRKPAKIYLHLLYAYPVLACTYTYIHACKPTCIDAYVRSYVPHIYYIRADIYIHVDAYQPLGNVECVWSLRGGASCVSLPAACVSLLRSTFICCMHIRSWHARIHTYMQAYMHRCIRTFIRTAYLLHPC